MLRTLRSSQTLLWWVLLSVSVLLLSVGFSAYAAAQSDGAKADAIHETCVGLQNLNKVITQTLGRSKQNLPKLTYYREHPDELRIQIREINRELLVFRPRTCR